MSSILIRKPPTTVWREKKDGRCIPECFRVDNLWPVWQLDNDVCPRTREGECYKSLLQFMRETDEKPEYGDDVKNMVSQSPVIKIGEPFDVISLLSFKGQSNYLVRNSGLRVELNRDTFLGKYVMVCCFHAPLHRLHEDAFIFQSLANICYEKYNSLDDDFEIVLVLMMNSKANNSRYFYHFLSAFPSSCLVVPFDDPKRRDYIFCYLDVSLSCRCFIVNGSSIALLNTFPSFAMCNGADMFPFYRDPNLEDELDCFRPWTTRLQEFLGSIAYNTLHKINQGGAREEVSFSKLNEKVVGLYLCSEETCCIDKQIFIHTLHKVYEQCRYNQQEFEIVVFYIPFIDCLSPEVYQSKLDSFMDENRMCWWRMPFNNSKCQRLWEICGHCPDNLVIVGPHSEYLDLNGGEILSNLGSAAYPFTREALIRNHVELLREHTLESLLVSEQCHYVLRGDTRITVASLQPKNILLYFGSFKNVVLFDNLREWYGVIKTKNPNFEVIVVHIISEGLDTNDYIKAIDSAVSDLPWLVRPFETNHSRCLEKKLFPQIISPYNTLVSFGIDGHVCSVDTQYLFHSEGLDGFPFEENLRRDVISRFQSMYPFMEDME